MSEESSLIHQQHAEQMQREREFRKAGETYRGEVMPLENQLSGLENIQGVGEVIKRSIQSLGQEMAINPKLWEAVVAYRSIDYTGTQQPPAFAGEVTAPMQFPVAEQLLQAHFDASPLAHFLRSKVKSDEEYQTIRDHLVDRIARFAQAARRADEINSATTYKTSDQREVPGHAGQITYNFERYLNLSAEAVLSELTLALPEGTEFSDLDSVINSSQAELLAKLDSETKFYSLLNWVVQTAQKVRTENLKIFDTPETDALLARLEAVARQRNGLGGAILFGPPGTGKTETLVERNQRMGFDSRVISIHHFSDYAQLLGERPVPVGIDKTTSQVQRLQMVETTVGQMDSNQRLEFVLSKFGAGIEAWQTFLSLANSETVVVNNKSDLTPELAETIIKNLLTKLRVDITNIGLGVQAGLDEETAWVRGEIIQAFDHGQLPILDEMDKGSDHSLEGISRLLNLSPGSKMMLGDEEYTIPTWARVDGTANAMNLAPFLHDRFAPNIIYVDYSPAQETMLKSLVWLADEQGLLTLPIEKQQQFVGLALYVFPAIQQLYPEPVEHALSNRGIRKFCQMIAGGESVSTALNELLLKPGALTNTEKGRVAIQRILDRFATLTTPAVSIDGTQAAAQKSDLVQSPLYAAVSEYFLPFNTTEGSLGEVTVTAEQSQALLESRTPKAENTNNVLDTQAGTTVSIEQKGDKFGVAVRVDGKLLTKVNGSDEVQFTAESRVADADLIGQIILVRHNNTLNVIDIASGKTRQIISSESQSSNFLSPDGEYLISRVGSEVSLRSIKTIMNAAQDTDAPIIRFVDEDGEPLRCTKADVSDDGALLHIETTTNATFIVNLHALHRGQSTIMLTRPFVQEAGWQLTRGNMLVKPNSEKAYLLKA